MATTFAKNTIRAETAPLALSFGGAAHVVVRAARHRPDLAARILLGPRRDVHTRAALAAHLYREGAAVARIADALADECPRDTIRQVFGDGADPRLFRTLDRAALPAWPIDDYHRLHDLLRHGLHDALPDQGEFSRHDVRRLHLLLDGDPVLRRARRAFPKPASMQALADVLSVLRRLGAGAALDGLPDRASRSALLRRLRADLGGLRSPHGQFPAPPGWRVIGSAANLWTLGARMNLCFGWHGGPSTVCHTLSLVGGTSVFLHNPDAGVVAELARSFDGSFHVAELAAARNAPAPEGLLRELREGLVSTGLPMTHAGVEAALHSLLWSLDGLRADLEAAEDPIS
ncbi:MAG: hypothetical protein K2X11_11980 [Acetobacteraceae bacterium]|nr:hypothetical protein [Acetobacteraceae bacterium]